MSLLLRLDEPDEPFDRFEDEDFPDDTLGADAFGADGLKDEDLEDGPFQIFGVGLLFLRLDEPFEDSLRVIEGPVGTRLVFSEEDERSGRMLGASERELLVRDEDEPDRVEAVLDEDDRFEEPDRVAEERRSGYTSRDREAAGEEFREDDVDFVEREARPVGLLLVREGAFLRS